MDLNNNQVLLLAVAAVALYFFMKYRECSKQENFSKKIAKTLSPRDQAMSNLRACMSKESYYRCGKKVPRQQ